MRKSHIFLSTCLLALLSCPSFAQEPEEQKTPIAQENIVSKNIYFYFSSFYNKHRIVPFVTGFTNGASWISTIIGGLVGLSFFSNTWAANKPRVFLYLALGIPGIISSKIIHKMLRGPDSEASYDIGFGYGAMSILFTMAMREIGRARFE